MNININNIGNIDNADIKLDGITVVAGKNGSGKSTICKSIFLLLDYFGSYNSKVSFQRKRSIRVAAHNFIRKYFRDNYIDFSAMHAMLVALFGTGLEEQDFDEALKHEFDKLDIDLHEREVNELHRIYKEIRSKDEMYYAHFAAQQLVDNIFANQMNTIGKKVDGTVQYSEKEYKSLIQVRDNKVVDVIRKGIYNKSGIVYITTTDLMDLFGSNRKMYRAQENRIISYSNNKLMNLLLLERSTEDVTAEEYEQWENRKSLFNELFKEVVTGRIANSEGKLIYHDDELDSDIDFLNIASGMKIFLILQRLIENGMMNPGMVLVMDEPETNLHPEWQLKLAELLVRLYKEMGIIIYANSHSPYFVRAIEFYADKYQVLDDSKFYFMKQIDGMKLYESIDVTEQLGIVYDELAEPFNQIM